MKRKFTPSEWQKNPENLDKTLPTIQYWTWQGTMLTAQMTLETGRQLVKEGRAFIITGQAISQMPQLT